MLNAKSELVYLFPFHGNGAFFTFDQRLFVGWVDFFFFLIFFPTVFFLLLTGKQLKSTSSYHHIYWLITSFIHSSLFRFRLFFILLLFASYFLDLYEIADANQKPFFESSIAAKKSSQANVSECNIHKNNNKLISMKKLALRYQRLI